MNIKVLTDGQIGTLFREQAVLQSSEVQGLLNALQEVVNAADGDGWTPMW